MLELILMEFRVECNYYYTLLVSIQILGKYLGE